MNRREWVKTFGALSPVSLPAAASRSSARLERLRLRHTWTTTMSSSDYRDTVHVALVRDGITGRGEGAPIVRYKETPAGALEAVNSLLPVVEKQDWRAWRKLLDTLFKRTEGQYAARAAIDIALLDWVAQKAGQPLCRYFGLDPRDAPVTTFSIGIDTPEITRRKTREAAPYPILKVKVGLATDEATIEAIRGVTRKPLRVDANEGWRDKEEAVRKINWLESQGVEFVEQPMPADMLEEVNWVRKRVHLPVIADEASLRPEDVPRLANYYDGVNIKLDKCGGVLEALRMIEMARALKMKTMLGCMISSSVSVTAAAHLSPLVDYADLDGNLLIANDPYQGVRVENGKLILPDGPGLGLRR